MKQRGFLGLLVACTLAASPASPTDGPKVTIATQKGDIVEGVFLAATATEISVEVAGQPLKIPLSGIKYISFVGVLGTGGSDAKTSGPAPGSMEAAFASLHKLREALKVGVLRAQYSEKLVETLPAVNAFLESGSDWPDVRNALRLAVDTYQLPMGPVSRYSNPWGSASVDFSLAADYVQYAEKLAANPEERDHHESPEETGLEIGQSSDGRLGVGDRTAPKTLSGRWGGLFADRYVLRVPSAGKLSLSLTADTGLPGIILADSSGGRVAETKRGGYTATLEEDIHVPGTYHVWVAGSLGHYRISAKFVPK